MGFLGILRDTFVRCGPSCTSPVAVRLQYGERTAVRRRGQVERNADTPISALLSLRVAPLLRQLLVGLRMVSRLGMLLLLRQGHTGRSRQPVGPDDGRVLPTR